MWLCYGCNKSWWYGKSLKSQNREVEISYITYECTRIILERLLTIQKIGAWWDYIVPTRTNFVISKSCCSLSFSTIYLRRNSGNTLSRCSLLPCISLSAGVWKNASKCMRDVLSGMVIEVSELHILNAYSSIRSGVLLNLSSLITIFSRAVHFAKAFESIIRTVPVGLAVAH